jgi:hypothetical protein
MNDATLKSSIESYTERKVKSLKVHADEKVAGAYAMRATMSDGDTIDFLLQANPFRSSRVSPEALAEELEEAEWKSWPPKAGRIQYRMDLCG